MVARTVVPTLAAAATFALVATVRMHAPSITAAAHTLEQSDPEPGAYGTYGDATCGLDAPTEADFVVIGGGTAGCALAARLCENLPEASVVVLDRSLPRTEEEELVVRSPRLIFAAWGTPGVSEAIETEPNPGLGGRTIMQLTGRTLGGSSSINAAQWTKPPLATFDRDTWDFAGLDSATAGDLYRRAERQLQVAQPPPELQHTYLPEYLAAAAAAGIPTDPDPLSRTGPPTDGIWPNVLAIDAAGRRVDSCTGYLSPAIAEGGACANNLKLIQAATVTKIVIEGGRAVGVRYLQTDAPEGEQEREIAAGREVVSSAGPYASPQLLQLSGIGPVSVLEDLDVPQLVELPVGENTVARPATVEADLYTAVPLAPEGSVAAAMSPEPIAAFNAGRGGALAVSAVASNGVLAAENAYSIFSNVPFQPGPENLILSTCGINPTARGKLRAASSDPRQPPVLDTNFLGSDADVRDAVACLSRLRAVHELLREPLGLQSPAPELDVPFRNASAAAIEMSVRNGTGSIFHFGGGCAVGRVVDAEFRVKGVEGLRVVDASVLPEMPPFAGPMATVYMLAELAAEVIAAEHAVG